MIREIEIEGFKSITQLKLKPGRVTVLIGENGCGKSNILEAIAFASAACARRLEHEFLASRGIRMMSPYLMRPAFRGEDERAMSVRVGTGEEAPLEFQFQEDETTTVPRWIVQTNLIEQERILEKLGISGKDELPVTRTEEIGSTLDSEVEKLAQIIKSKDALVRNLKSELDKKRNHRFSEDEIDSIITGTIVDYLANKFVQLNIKTLENFIIFSPENSALRAFQEEGQILPLGIRGEGLFAHLRALKRAGKEETLQKISHSLELIDWFSGFDIPDDLGPGEYRLNIVDRFLDPQVFLDQRSANEGFLFLLFYFTLLTSPDTPHFFAIDNIDASLNPRLCERLMTEMISLAKRNDRQLIVTTHNPAILDGLDLTDDEQKLMVVSRTPNGHTRVRRVHPPRQIKGSPSMRLSEAFVRGHLGGLPSNF